MYPIKNCPGYYINEEGEVFSCVKKNFKVKLGCETYIDESNPVNLTPHIHPTNGYVYIGLGKFGQKRLHRVIAQTFIENPDNLPEVNHIDENKTNNNVRNLEWVDRQRNAEHSLAKHYLVENIKTGDKFEVFNLSQFCKQNNLHVGSLSDTRTPRRKQHKGYRII